MASEAKSSDNQTLLMLGGGFLLLMFMKNSSTLQTQQIAAGQANAQANLWGNIAKAGGSGISSIADIFGDSDS